MTEINPVAELIAGAGNAVQSGVIGGKATVIEGSGVRQIQPTTRRGQVVPPTERNGEIKIKSLILVMIFVIGLASR